MHASMMFQSLPIYAVPSCKLQTQAELAAVLGVKEVPIGDTGLVWPSLEKEANLGVAMEQALAVHTAEVFSTDAIAQLDTIASRWEAQVQEREDCLRCYDWSFDAQLHRPCVAMVKALQCGTLSC